MRGPVRVLLVDDHPLVRAGVRRVLESEPRLLVVSEAQEGAEALAAIREHSPDLLVLDLALPGMDGFEVLRRAREIRPGLKIIVLTMHGSREYITRAIEAGADSYLLKDSAAHDLLSAIDAVLSGRAFHSPPVQVELAAIVRARGAEPPRPVDTLTAREQEVLRELAAGLSTKEIAVRLGIGRRTVDTHRANLMRKLGLHSVALLTRFAIREGVVRVP